MSPRCWMRRHSEQLFFVLFLCHSCYYHILHLSVFYLWRKIMVYLIVLHIQTIPCIHPYISLFSALLWEGRTEPHPVFNMWAHQEHLPAKLCYLISFLNIFLIIPKFYPLFGGYSALILHFYGLAFWSSWTVLASWVSLSVYLKLRYWDLPCSLPLCISTRISFTIQSHDNSIRSFCNSSKQPLVFIHLGFTQYHQQNLTLQPQKHF